MKSTKIIATIGPASDQEIIIRQMVEKGLNVARINLSHGTLETAQTTIDRLKKVRDELGVPLGIMLDTKGPEIRIKTFKDGKITLAKGQPFVFTTRNVAGDQNQVSVTYLNLHKDVKAGGMILLNDGLLAFSIEKVNGQDIHCVALNDGVLSDQKGMHFPSATLSLPFLSDADQSDLIFAVKNKVDFIAASFVSCAENVNQMRTFLMDRGLTDCRIVAKIENQAGVDNADEILRVADAIMVARGDMGVEIDFCMLPKIQKDLIKKAQAVGKEVIVATEMLESMIVNARPTRAEISDVANAVYDETSAVMLSGETASGKYPVKAVETMANICTYVESTIKNFKRFKDREINESSVTDTMCHAACNAAMQLGAKAIVVSTKSGKTARAVAKFRPSVPIVTFVLSEKTYHQLSLSWGVRAVYHKDATTVEELIGFANDYFVQTKLAQKNDLFVVLAGIPLGQKGNTNFLQIEKVKA